ncbi:PTS system N,N'-diacetylchitobiose-specific transporter subunit IIA [Citrobacter freundii]|nr:PTS system N,N'-diacetylchitobiose-specific transporter subunit IIA [Citrobacter freundii]
MEELETIIMELLVNAGAARSQALTALQLARKGDFAGAEHAMMESREYVKQAHKIQTQLIGIDEGTGKLPVNLIHRPFAGPPDECHGDSGSGRRHD